MRARRRVPLSSLLIGLLLAPALDVEAEPSTLLSFSAPQGDNVTGVFLASDGCLYASLLAGGSSNLGAIVKRDRNGRISVLHSFDGTDGSAPAAALVQGSDGNLYGTTSRGGAFDYGTAFAITPAGALTTLHSFSLEEGGPSRAPLLLASDGQLYGVNAGVYVTSPPTFQSLSHGSVFRLGGDGSLTTLHHFDGSDGSKPLAALIEGSDGQLYGTTSQLQDTVGAHPWNLSWGTVFRIALDGSFTSLHTFAGPDGGNPLGQLLEAEDGSLYGTTFGASQWQGPGTPGNIFRITPDGSFEDLHTFDDAAIGNGVNAGLVAGGDGWLYGATSASGPNGLGSFFRFSTSGTIQNLHAFTVQESGPSAVQLMAAGRGSWFGATHASIFQIDTRGRLRTLNRLGFLQGREPTGGLTLARDGYYYGTTNRGGSYGYGTIYRWRPGSELKVLYSFAGSSFPGAPQQPSELIQGSDGALYGTSDGASGFGILFRITTNGNFSTLYSFVENGSTAYPGGKLMQASDGKLYGLARAGGAYGSVYSFDLRSRTLTTLHTFGDAGDLTGFHSLWAGLVEHPDGNLYGVSESGGEGEYFGTLYRLSKTGQLTTLHSFAPDGAEGTAPIRLTLSPQGTFYGASGSGGLGGGGALFEATTTGSVTSLRGFLSRDPATGSDPTIPLLLGSDQKLYGANYNGGANGGGTLFSLDQTGNLTILRAFEQDPSYISLGINPLVQGPDGTIYGTTRTDGAAHAGTIYGVKP